MSEDREQQIKLQFLEEAGEYLDTIESGLLGLGGGSLHGQRVDGVLRAAHSIKGGAAMMGFEQLSHLAHRMEDFFKVLRAGKPGVVDGETERLLLSGVDLLRQVVAVNRQLAPVDEVWLETNVNPIFDQLHDRIGEPQPEDSAAMLSAEVGEDMSVLLFQTEVEGCLQRLEAVLADPEMPCLLEELKITAEELCGLGEMLDLQAFSSLCQSILDALEATPEQLETIARVGLQEWRRSQALVLVGQTNALPSVLNLDNISLETVISPPDLFSDEENFIEDFDDSDRTILTDDSIQSLIESDDFEEDALDVFSSLDDIALSEPDTNKDNLLDVALDLLSTETAPSPKPQPQQLEVENLKKVEARPQPTPPVKETSADNTIRVSVRPLEELGNLFGELTIERNGLDLQLRSLRKLIGLLSSRVKTLEQSNFRLRATYDRVGTEAAKPDPVVGKILVPQLAAANSIPSQNTKNGYTGNFDLLEMDNYSELHLLSQEVMESVVQIQEVTKDIEINLEDTERTSRKLTRTSKRMQTSLTQVRMRPFSELLGRFPRALRDMELMYGKKVKLKVRGGSTLIERTILEALNDPLLHLLRNGFDHGIELPATRVQNGKPEEGTIEISASYRGNQTLIIIKDDGSGINLDKIRGKAMKMGLDENDIARASDAELLDLIFEPGFSTADKVTDLSGRGVGMDVVRTNLQQIRGEISVETKAGLGTTFTITVPFTLSVVRVLLIESNGMLLAFPANAVEEMLPLAPEMVLNAAGNEVLNWEGAMVRLIKLSKWLQFPRSNQMPDNEEVPTINEPTVLMIAQGDDLVGIQVDRYWAEQEVSIRQVEGNIKMPLGFTGCTILGDGRVVPLVDALGLLSWINNNGQGQSSNLSFGNTLLESDSKTSSFAASDRGAPTQKHTVMVVDDSINVRRFLALTLEKAGYRVEQGKDGQDALEKLQAGLAVEAVISDIEMPRLDGFGFLGHLKSDPKCKHIPVVMLTSRIGDKHRKLAMNLGATDYFSKPFREQELLQTIKKLIAK